MPLITLLLIAMLSIALLCRYAYATLTAAAAIMLFTMFYDATARCRHADASMMLIEWRRYYAA